MCQIYDQYFQKRHYPSLYLCEVPSQVIITRPILVSPLYDTCLSHAGKGRYHTNQFYWARVNIYDYLECVYTWQIYRGFIMAQQCNAITMEGIIGDIKGSIFHLVLKADSSGITVFNQGQPWLAWWSQPRHYICCINVHLSSTRMGSSTCSI